MKCLPLSHRGLVSIKGPDARTLLQDVISCEVEGLTHGVVQTGALLTPQGKIFFDFLISHRGEDGFLFDLNRDQVPAFIQRMTMYRLRAKAEIASLEELTVHALWNCDGDKEMLTDGRFHTAHVYRAYGPARPASAMKDEYDILRIESGVAEAGDDYAPSDVFPHDVLMDLNGGISFKKGCFVGQEVISRMQHRATARKRIVLVHADVNLPGSETAITHNDRSVGILGTVVGSRGLALVRIDKIANALNTGGDILADTTPVTVRFAAWTGLSFSPHTPADEV